ncbi:MAG: GTPase ObgE [Victivallaceae bacterium]|nr:GTPase ObgE [Victivallaceae bacterium]
MFVDKATIRVSGGNGGNGCCSFRREKFVPRGGPDGGDGGSGGNVVLRADFGEQSLIDLMYNRHYAAPSGPQGKGKDQHGARAADIVVRIPVGTVVTDTETGEVVADMSQEGQTFIAAHGGRGGRGNARFLSNHNRAPRIKEPGEPGEVKELFLELKTIADVGLVGYPNAGKSTLLRAISAARPKVAPYPFTTLHPVVGTVVFPDYARFTVADIPGLIDGAHRNVGLGHEFLKHIERTHILLYVLDMAGVDGRDPLEDLMHLRNELELYMKGLSKRPALIACNKMDMPEAAENLERLRTALASEVIDLVPICAEKGEVLNLEETLRRRLEEQGVRHIGSFDATATEESPSEAPKDTAQVESAQQG